MKTKSQEETKVILNMTERIKELEKEVKDLTDKVHSLSTDKEYDV